MHSYRIVDDEIAVVEKCGSIPTFFSVSIYKDKPYTCPVCGKSFVLEITTKLVECELDPTGKPL